MKIKSKKASYIPGDNLREMTDGHVDLTGRTWPRGTKYRPSSAGHDSAAGSDTQTVIIAGKSVAFGAVRS